MYFKEIEPITRTTEYTLIVEDKKEGKSKSYTFQSILCNAKMNELFNNWHDDDGEYKKCLYS